MTCVLIVPRVLLLGPARKSRKSTNFATHRRTSNKRRGAAVLEPASSRRRRNHLGKNLGRRVVGYGRRSVRRSATDPLTRLAPADEGAGCDPPSPPRGRGRGILRIEHFVNVEARGAGFQPAQGPPRWRRHVQTRTLPGDQCRLRRLHRLGRMRGKSFIAILSWLFGREDSS